MSVQVTSLVQDQMVRSLNALKGILTKAETYASAKKVDFSVLLNTRLAPDQFPLIKQIQITCDTAKFTAARLSGVTPPKNDDSEKDLPQVLKRIDQTIDFIRSVDEGQFEGYEKREVRFPWYPGKWMDGHTYLYQHAQPNFYFHLTTAYSILRANGVDIGKGDFLGEQNWRSE